MNDVDQLLETLDILVVVNPVPVAEPHAPGIIDGGSLRDDEADPAGCHAFVEGLHLFPHVHVVFMHHDQAGPRLDDAVPRFHGPDVSG